MLFVSCRQRNKYVLKRMHVLLEQILHLAMALTPWRRHPAPGHRSVKPTVHWTFSDASLLALVPPKERDNTCPYGFQPPIVFTC